MKISQAISKLTQIKDEVGDLELIMLTDLEDGRFVIDRDRDLDVIELPDENDNLDHSEIVCAFMEPIDPTEGEIDRRLKLVKK